MAISNDDMMEALSTLRSCVPRMPPLQTQDASEFWHACESGPWLAWLVGALDLDTVRMRRLACEWAEPLLVPWRGEYPEELVKMVRMVRRHLRGEVAIEQLVEQHRIVRLEVEAKRWQGIRRAIALGVSWAGAPYTPGALVTVAVQGTLVAHLAAEAAGLDGASAKQDMSRTQAEMVRERWGWEEVERALVAHLDEARKSS
jgi:hypothetical protein